MADPKPFDPRKLMEITKRVVEEQTRPCGKLSRELTDQQDEVSELRKAKPVDKKALDAAIKKRDAKRDALEKCYAEFDLNSALSKLKPPDDAGDGGKNVDFKKLLEPLPKILRDAIERQGVPLSKHGTLKLDLEIDYDKWKVKKAGATIEWELP